jgi:hypothetical protein
VKGAQSGRYRLWAPEAMRLPTDGVDVTESREAFLAQQRDAYGRLVYTHKTHEKMAEIKSWRHNALNMANIGLVALTLCSVIADMASKEGDWWFSSVKIFTITSASAALIFAFIQLSFDPGREAEKHETAAKSFLRLRDSYESLLTDAVGGDELSSLQARRDALQNQKSEVESSAPPTKPKAYKKAARSLDVSESVTLTPDDINRILPHELRPQNK